MADININEYVRTDNGIIGKYIIQQNINYIDTGKQYIGFDIENDIVKHSSNIINLLDLGDLVEVIVNEWFDGEEKQIDTEIYEVTAVNITDIKGKKIEKIGIIENDETIFIGIEKIVSILTEEQYENNCYKVEE